MQKWILGLPLAALLLVPTAAAFSWGMPKALTERGKIVEDIYVQIAIAGAIVFLIVFAWLVLVLVRYRHGTGKGRATFEHERENLKAELGWTIIPLMIVLWVGWIAYGGLLALDTEADEMEPEFTLHVTGVRYSWIGDYGPGAGDAPVRVTSSFDPFNPDATMPLLVPADVPVKINLTADSEDILHAMNILDANNAYVWISDANTGGPTKYTHGTIVFPEGEYMVQCKEHCFNPGHAYMRGKISAVPMAEFQEWLAVKQLEAGAERVVHIDVDVTQDGLVTEAPLEQVKGSRIIAKVTNQLAQDVTVSARTSSIDVPSGRYQYLAFDAPAPGSIDMAVSTGDKITFTILDAEVVRVVLGEYFIDPTHARLEAGKTYLMQVVNEGAQGHNIFIGDFGTNRVDWKSIDIAGGQTTAFVVQTTTPVSLNTWCNIPGHYDLGMFGTMTVS
ncbi:MAG: hypothetical protein ACPGQL_02355 [Thermoplasmatota archaeon]